MTEMNEFIYKNKIEKNYTNFTAFIRQNASADALKSIEKKINYSSFFLSLTKFFDTKLGQNVFFWYVI